MHAPGILATIWYYVQYLGMLHSHSLLHRFVPCIVTEKTTTLLATVGQDSRSHAPSPMQAASTRIRCEVSCGRHVSRWVPVPVQCSTMLGLSSKQRQMTTMSHTHMHRLSIIRTVGLNMPYRTKWSTGRRVTSRAYRALSEHSCTLRRLSLYIYL